MTKTLYFFTVYEQKKAKIRKEKNNDFVTWKLSALRGRRIVFSRYLTMNFYIYQNINVT